LSILLIVFFKFITYISTLEIKKKEQKKRLNAKMRRLVTPKSPLMVFSELFKGVPILLQEKTINNVKGYTATFEVR